MTEGHRRPAARRTAVLVLTALLGGLALLAVSDGSTDSVTASGTTTPTPAVPEGEDPEPGMSQGLERLTSIEQPLSVWLRIADCESGEWDAEADPIPGSAEWSYGAEEDQRFEGGLHFEPSTWEDFREPGMPDHAGEATPVAQLVVAERVLEQQGWQAWPVCSKKLGLR